MTDETEISPSNDETEASPPLETPEKKPRKPALTINIYSWATPIVGVLMLVVGLLAGYFSRPLIARATPAPTTVAKATTAPQTSNAGLKDAVVAMTRHFTGDENAPVTIVEFADFQ